jgi:hypothetical protein
MSAEPFGYKTLARYSDYSRLSLSEVMPVAEVQSLESFRFKKGAKKETSLDG